MKRRDFVKLGLVSSCFTFLDAKDTKTKITSFPSFSKPLPIPSILEPKILEDGTKEFNLNVQEGAVEFLKGTKTKTYGVNTNFLGQTIRVKHNDKVKMNVTNSLKQNTVIHWHGLQVPASCDGGPNRNIFPNKTWTTQFTINQRSSMCWYHPHTYMKTGFHTFMGIAGLFIIDDKDSLNLKIPKNYGEDDIPLVVQDRRFDMQGQFLYKQSMHDVMMGVTGNFSLINGVVDPYLKVSPKTIRLRILNGSNARIYKFMFSDNRDFYQIAGDSSFLPKPVKLKRLILSPAERAEILVDLSDLAGKEILLGDEFSNKPLLQLRIKDEKTLPSHIPNKLITIDEYKEKVPNIKIREFELNMRPMWLAINDKQMNINRIDEEVTLNTTEIWRIKNLQRMPHPFHIHGCSFKILSRDKKPAYINESGLKDTVLVYGNETVDLLVKFNYKADKKYPYMYHCHILEHEDEGMMGQFTVT